MLAFIVILFLGFIYEITVGVLSWYPQLWESAINETRESNVTWD
jgi:hypothetical protein